MNHIKRTMIMQDLISRGWVFGVNQAGELFMQHAYQGVLTYKNEEDFEHVLNEINVY